MSYTLRLHCGCTIYVACHPRTGVAHARILETRGCDCRDRRHVTGARLWLWELLPGRPVEGPFFLTEGSMPERYS
jgi:hypothetical protein